MSDATFNPFSSMTPRSEIYHATNPENGSDDSCPFQLGQILCIVQRAIAI